MIRSECYIRVNDEPWRVIIFLPVTGYHVDEIMDALLALDINEENYMDAAENLRSGRVNNGLTFSNAEHRATVSVWAMATSPAQYFNLIVHELHHLSVQIATSNGLDLEGEDVCYINGDIAQYLYPLCRPLIT